MWFQIDMGSPRVIERVTLDHPAGQQPLGYEVQVSTDGQSWQAVSRKDDNWARVDARFDPVNARHVRVETTKSSTFEPWGISGFVVWRSSPVWLVGRRS
jgi:hypothetical protein